MELGIYTFAERTPDPDGTTISPQQRLADLLEEIELADQVGLDVFGVGEHHRPDFAVSAPAVVLGAVELLPPWTVKQYVLVYMAVGHHVPTFLRAYGDPDEFQRNRWRLVAVPLLVVPVLAAAYWIDARIVGLIFVWDQFHFVRQNYGMMRIYDAKAGARSTGRLDLDQWLCFSAFVAIVSHSDFFTPTYSETFFDLGLPVPAWVGSPIGTGSLSVTVEVCPPCRWPP